MGLVKDVYNKQKITKNKEVKEKKVKNKNKEKHPPKWRSNHLPFIICFIYYTIQMAPSPSGPLRQLFGPARAHLHKKLSTTATTFPELGDPVSLQNAEQQRFQLQTQLNILNKSIETCNKHVHDWTELLYELEDNTIKEDELKIFNEWSEHETLGFSTLLVNAEERQVLLTTFLKELETVIQNLHLELASASTRSRRTSTEPDEIPPTAGGPLQPSSAALPPSSSVQIAPSVPAPPPATTSAGGGPGNGTGHASTFQNQGFATGSAQDNGTIQQQDAILGSISPIQHHVPLQLNQVGGPPVMKLQSYHLPNFDGDPLQWTEFFDLFNSSVHIRPDLQPVQKFMYLKNYLRGSAAAAIAGMSVTNLNYTEALEILQRRFGKPHIIKNALYSKIQSLRIPPDRVSALRSTLDAVERILRQLKNLGDAIDHPTLLHILLTKLPVDALTELERLRKPEDEWTVHSLREALEHVIDSKERVFRYTSSQSSQSHMYGGQHSAVGNFNRQGTRFQSPQNSYRPPFVNQRPALRPAPTFQPRMNQPRYPIPQGNRPFNRAAAEGRQFVPASQNRQFFPSSSVDTFAPVTPAQMTANKKGIQRIAPISCVYCSGNHYSDQCDTYKTGDSRRDRLMKLDRCLACLGPRHRATQCRSKRKCYYCKVENASHHQSICNKRQNPLNSAPHIQNTTNAAILRHFSEPQFSLMKNSNVENEVTAVTQTNASVYESKDSSFRGTMQGKPISLLLTASIKVRNESETLERNAFVFFDTGSQKTFITDELAESLQLSCVRKESLNICTFATDEIKRFTTRVVPFKMVLENGKTTRVFANVHNKLLSPIYVDDISEEDSAFLVKYIPRFSFTQKVTTASPDILIGSDMFWDFVDEKIAQLPSGRYLISTKFGLLVTGRGMKVQDKNDESIINCCAPQVTELHKDGDDQDTCTVTNNEDSQNTITSNFWDLEKIGIFDSVSHSDDREAQKMFERTLLYKNGQYHVTWPWKKLSEDVFLPTNYVLALNRFKSLTRRFQKEPSLLPKYEAVIEEQKQKGYIEKAPQITVNKVHYLSHHPIIREAHSTTKVRVVLDASAKIPDGTAEYPKPISLNEAMYRGPIILPDLVGMLIRFRMYVHPILADVEKAFLQLVLQEHERDVTRFLWYSEPEKLTTKNNLEEYRFCRVPFGVISSPFLLEATIRHHLTKNGGTTALKIAENIYVDNVIVGVENAEEGKKLYYEAKQLFREASMNLREWTSNCSELMAFIPKEDHAKQSDEVKVLGIKWNIQGDFLVLNIPQVPQVESPTKRVVLHNVASIF